MKLSRLYNKIVKLGSELDPRKNKKPVYFEDTAILYGNPDTEIEKILVGIDIDVGDLLLADRIRSRQGLDLVVAHHPEGRAWAVFYEVMQLQVDLLAKAGVSRQIAEKFMAERKEEVARRVMPQNHTHSVDAARLLDLPFMCVHTPADNHVAGFIHSLLDKEKPQKVWDIVNILEAIPEYKEAKEQMCGPKIILGSPRRPAGKIFIEMTGGTEGHKDIYGKLYKAGIRTLVCMHLSEEHFKKVKDADLNVVIAGHISSDTLGLNLLLDRIEKEENFLVTGCSGFKRIKR